MDFSIEKIEKPSTEVVVGDEIQVGEKVYMVNKVVKTERDMNFHTTVLDDSLSHTSKALLVIPKTQSVFVLDVVIKP